MNYKDIEITGGFWKEKQTLVRNTTAMAVYRRFDDTGRIGAFRCDWKEGTDKKPHFFWDSDVAKWIEGVAYLTAKKREPKLEKLADSIIDDLVKNQGEDGYFNIYFTVVAPERRFADRDCHELYCAGHLIEAGVAYYEATGKRKLLDAMRRYADYIEKRFIIQADTGFLTPGHEEIELALVRLWRCTGEKRYLSMAKHFLDIRGKCDMEGKSEAEMRYTQAHLPVREQRTAEGHAVRAVYLYSAMADIAYITGDSEMKTACEAIFEDIVTKKMYITGGIGSSSFGEAFTVAYDLSNLLAYTESCASIGLAFFANRMLRFGPDSRYSDVIERVLYNGLSSVSLDGKSFFYENPLEIIPYLPDRDTSRYTAGKPIHWPQMQRSEVFGCSCCPPNIVRYISSIENYVASEYGDTLCIHQYIPSKISVLRDGRHVTVKMKTRFPENGKVTLCAEGGTIKLAVRVPSWAKTEYKTEKGYTYFTLSDGETVTLDFPMKPVYIEARPEAYFDCGKFAVMRGPVVYCMESADNGAYLRDIRLDSHSAFRMEKHGTLGVPCLTVRAFRRRRDENAPLYSEKHDSLESFRATLIPYYAFANRGVQEMQVWTFVK